MQLQSAVTAISGVGSEIASKLERLEIFTVNDLLQAFPRAYLDYSQKVQIAALSNDKPATLIATVKSFRNAYLKRGRLKSIQTAVLTDETGQIKATWFNMPFLENSLIPGTIYSFVAKLSQDKLGKPFINSPLHERYTAETLHSGRIVPVYALTTGLSPKIYRRLIKKIIDNLADINDFAATEIAPEIIAALNLQSKWLDRLAAFEQVHFPEHWDQLAAARFRLGVEELIPIQQKLLKQAAARAQAKAVAHLKLEPTVSAATILQDYWQRFQFTPTADQLSTSQEILTGFLSGKPEYRLIQGDVGSGKTAVAGSAIFLSFLCHKDVILMVPTTVLAEQHYQLFQQIFPSQVQLVTASTDVGKKTEFVRPNKLPQLFIGTQALLHRSKGLGLGLKLGALIIDEEHRFGVKQREQLAKLMDSKILPHYLSLTATPIPRTLALSIFGSINISVIATKPKQQLEKITYLVPESKRLDSLGWISEQINQGHQVFWVCPLIEEKREVDGAPVIISKDEKASVAVVYKKLSEHFQTNNPEIRLLQLHGKLKDVEKLKILADFKDKRAEILVCTTVIEVGIDIANANLIVIENAEQFGLAQLHQLRGRVGRGKNQGYCLVFSGSDTNSPRLKLFAQETDGMKLAEFDLQSRGPGEVYGRIQAGIPNLKIADLTNSEQVRISQALALSSLKD